MLSDNHTRLKAQTGMQVGARQQRLTSPYPLYTASEAANMCRENPAVRETIEWVWNFLAKPHSDLGRPGAVCPYVEKSMLIDKVWIASIDSPILSVPEIEEVVLAYRNIFVELDPTRGRETINKALMMVFPHVPIAKASDLIDRVQQDLKPQFTKLGLMLGEFHQHNMTPGLRNETFYPLRSPMPMLVIRYMVESDLPFLTREIDSPGRRVAFLKAYLRRLAGDLSDKQMDMMIDSLVTAMLEERGIHDLLVDAGCAEEDS